MRDGCYYGGNNNVAGAGSVGANAYNGEERWRGESFAGVGVARRKGGMGSVGGSSAEWWQWIWLREMQRCLTWFIGGGLKEAGRERVWREDGGDGKVGLGKSGRQWE
jgi:hypothetical protein